MNELQEIIQYYQRQGAPYDQSALVACLREAQSVCEGQLNEQAQQVIAQGLGVKPSFLQAVAKRISDLKLGGAAHTLTLCTGVNCTRKGKEIREYLEKELKVQAGKPFLNGCWIYQTAGCQRACRNAPNIRIDGKLIEGITLEQLKEKLKHEKM